MARLAVLRRFSEEVGVLARKKDRAVLRLAADEEERGAGARAGGAGATAAETEPDEEPKEEPDEYRLDSAIIAAAMEPTVGFAFALTLVRFLEEAEEEEEPEEEEEEEPDEDEDEALGVGVFGFTFDLAFFDTAALALPFAFTFGAPFAAFFSRAAMFQSDPSM